MRFVAHLRLKLGRLAARSTNADVVDQIVRRDRADNPTVADTVTELRKLRDTS